MFVEVFRVLHSGMFELRLVFGSMVFLSRFSCSLSHLNKVIILCENSTFPQPFTNDIAADIYKYKMQLIF